MFSVSFDGDDLKPKAFKSGCYINLVAACNTGVKGRWEESNITKFANIVDPKSKVEGSNLSVKFLGGYLTDAELLKAGEEKDSNGKIIKKGEVISIPGTYVEED